MLVYSARKRDERIKELEKENEMLKNELYNGANFKKDMAHMAEKRDMHTNYMVKIDRLLIELEELGKTNKILMKALDKLTSK